MTAQQRLEQIIAALPHQEGDPLNTWRGPSHLLFSVESQRIATGLATISETRCSGRLAAGTYQGWMSGHYRGATSTGRSNAVIFLAGGTGVAALPFWWDSGVISG